jgi:predicted transcriptional regulator YheO
VVADDEGNVTLEPSRLQSCILHLLEKPDERAAADLIYLVEHSTPSEKWFGCEEARENYRKLAAEYKPKLNSAQADKERQQAIDSLKEIVNGWGDTFPDARMEIVLHDVRNPLHSIVAIRNTITGRLPGDPITDFGVVLIKAYSTGSEERFAGYESKLKGGHRVKSTTVPIFHRKDELIALLCINIDVSDIRAGMEKVPDESIRQFLGAFVAVSKDREITEHIQNAPRG